MDRLVNLSFLEKFTGGNQSKIKRYISMYLATAPDILERMKKNLDAQNWSDLGINAHSLKPQTDFMGIVTLKNKLIEIENNLKINMGLDAQKAGVYFLDFTVGELTKSEILIKTK